MSRTNDVGGFIFGLIFGALGLTILGLFFKPKCPSCKNSINEGISMCPSCHTMLRWE
jgi:hypothetical protein